MAFPSSVPSYTGFTSTHTLSQDQHAAQHNSEQADIVALAQKLGTGASTPVNNTVLRGNGVGTSAYGLVRLDTDVAGVAGTANGGTGQTSLTSLPLVSPSITGGGTWTGAPTLSGPTIADFTNAPHGHTGASSGGQLGPSALVTNAVQGNQLDTHAITLGYAQITAGQTTTSATGAQIPGLSITVTIPGGNRYIEILVYSYSVSNSLQSGNYGLQIWDGVVGGGTQLQAAQISNNVGGSTSANMIVPVLVSAIVTPAAGSKTYNAGFFTNTGTITVGAQSIAPAYILARAI